jgi:hypothetical protein
MNNYTFNWCPCSTNIQNDEIWLNMIKNFGHDAVIFKDSNMVHSIPFLPNNIKYVSYKLKPEEIFNREYFNTGDIYCSFTNVEFPKNLTHLILPSDYDEKISKLHDNIEVLKIKSVSIKHIDYIPENLKSLIVTEHDDNIILPNNIQELCINDYMGYKFIYNNNNLKYLDINLRNNSIDTNILPSSIEVLKLDGYTQNPIQISNNLINLKKLYLSIPCNNNFFLEILTDTVEYLQINITMRSEKSISFIKKYSKNLKELSLQCFGYFSNTYINLLNLPLGIQKLKLINVNTDLTKLPDTINTLYLNNYDFSIPMTKLPSNLKNLFLIDESHNRKKNIGIIPLGVKLLFINYLKYTIDLELPESIEKLFVSDLKISNLPTNLKFVNFINPSKKINFLKKLISKSNKNIDISHTNYKIDYIYENIIEFSD